MKMGEIGRTCEKVWGPFALAINFACSILSPDPKDQAKNCFIFKAAHHMNGASTIAQKELDQFFSNLAHKLAVIALINFLGHGSNIRVTAWVKRWWFGLLFKFSHLITIFTFKSINTLRPRLDARHFANIFKCILLNGNLWISLKISLKFVLKVLINNIPALVQIMARRRSGDKPLSEPMMVSLLTHICVTRPQWVKFDIEKCSLTCCLDYTGWVVLKFGTHIAVDSDLN